MELSLPQGKIEKMRSMLDEFAGLKWVTKKRIEKLAGMLSHCATIIRGGRTFCRSIYNLDRAASRTPSHRVKITEEARSDIDWWTHCSYLFNGKSAIAKPAYHLYPTSDASLQGFACYLGEKWFYGTWNNDLFFDTGCGHLVLGPEINGDDKGNINVLELFPVYWALVVWGHMFASHKVCFMVDNLQVMFMVRTGRSINPTCMQWLKRMFWLCAEFDIDLHAEYIPTNDNNVADTLSRLGYVRVRKDVASLLEDHELCCIHDLFVSCRNDSILSPQQTSQATTSFNGPSNTKNTQSSVGML